MSPVPQNPKFQEPVTLDFLDAELENDIKVEVRSTDQILHTVVPVADVTASLQRLPPTCVCEIIYKCQSLYKQIDDNGSSIQMLHLFYVYRKEVKMNNVSDTFSL